MVGRNIVLAWCQPHHLLISFPVNVEGFLEEHIRILLRPSLPKDSNLFLSLNKRKLNSNNNCLFFSSCMMGTCCLRCHTTLFEFIVYFSSQITIPKNSSCKRFANGNTTALPIKKSEKYQKYRLVEMWLSPIFWTERTFFAKTLPAGSEFRGANGFFHWITFRTSAIPKILGYPSQLGNSVFPQRSIHYLPSVERMAHKAVPKISQLVHNPNFTDSFMRKLCQCLFRCNSEFLIQYLSTHSQRIVD